MNNLITKKELKDKLNVSIGKIDLLIKKKQIPYYKIDRLVRFDWFKVVESMEK
jgi:hypothetical protein